MSEPLEILPCPWCRGDHARVYESLGDWWIGCLVCEATGPRAHEGNNSLRRADAVARWNALARTLRLCREALEPAREWIGRQGGAIPSRTWAPLELLAKLDAALEALRKGGR